MTNTGPSVVSGDLDLTPGSSVTGFPPGILSMGYKILIILQRLMYEQLPVIILLLSTH